MPINNPVFNANAQGKTQLTWTGNANGNDAQGNSTSNSSPKIWLKTHQVSTYDSADTQDFGGYSELLRLQALAPKAKPTIAWLDMFNKSFAWLVGHYEPQDLLYYSNLAAFPATGVNDSVTGYKALDTGKYYYWNGSAYIEITPSDERYYYMATHQHLSIETADNTGSSNYTRLDYPYGFNVVPLNTSNAHLRVKTGVTVHGTEFGAFIVESGKMYGPDRFDFYPSANVASSSMYKNDNTNNIFTLNTESFRVEKLLSGNGSNPTGATAIGIGTSNAIANLVLTRSTWAAKKITGIEYISGIQDKPLLAKTSAAILQYGVPGANFTSVNTTNLIANAIRYIPFFVGYTILLSSFQFEVTTSPASNANVRIGIYNSNSFYQPTTLVQDFGSVTVANTFTGIKTQSINQSLDPGWYLLAANCDVQTGIRCFISSSPILNTSLGTTPFVQRFDVNSTFGAFATTGVQWATTNNASSGLQNIVTFQWS